MLILVFLVVTLLVLSFISSLSESVILSVTNQFIEKLTQEKKPIGVNLREMKHNIDRSLSSILIVNTLVNTFGAIIIGAQSLRVFGADSVIYMSLLLTVLILFFSEIVPKSLGAYYWKELATPVVRYLQCITLITAPLLKITDFVTQFIKSGKSAASVNREDIILLAEISAKAGKLDHKESEIITNFLQMPEIEVNEIMTPRTVIFTLNEKVTVSEFCQKHIDCAFSRIPVYSESEDNLTGFVMKSDIFKAYILKQEDRQIGEFQRKIKVIPETLHISELLNLLLNKKFQIALPVDEYGTVVGLVTLEDIVEFIIGREIMDESDAVRDLRNMAVQRWKKKIVQHKLRKEIMVEPTEETD